MNYKIPSGTFNELMNCYRDLIDQTYEIFGVECDLIYSDIIQSAALDTDNNYPDFNSINARRRRMPQDYDTDTDSISKVEVSEKIKVKIYTNPKEWYAIYGFTAVPKDHILVLSHLDDANRINKSIKLRYIDNHSNVYTFTRVSETLPYGFQKNKYASSIWKSE